jgi:hypothetical protein
VISAHKIRANRANARASTGPKTADGRTRAARNALRHALSLPVCSHPALSEDIETLAREIAGPDANAEIQELAHQIAESQIDLRRVRSARHELLSAALCDPDYDSRAAKRKRAKLAIEAAKLRARLALSPHLQLTPLLAQLLIALEGSVQSSPEGRRSSRPSLPTCLGSLPPWTGMNGERYRGASLRFGLSMRHEGKPPAREAAQAIELQQCHITTKSSIHGILAERSQNG